MPLNLPGKEQLLFMANVIAGKLFFKKKSTKPIHSILVIKWDEIGDMATATHVFELLKNSYPEAQITVLCKPFVRNLIEHDMHIHRIICDSKEWTSRYDVVIELRGTLTTFLKAFYYFPKIRLSRADVRWKNRGNQLHETLTNFKVIQGLLPDATPSISPVLYSSAEDKQKVESFLIENQVQRFAILHVSARRKLRQWPGNRFALAADHLYKNHGLQILFIGSSDERHDIALVQGQMQEKSLDVSGQFSLSELSALCAKAAFFLGNESGPLHIASAFRVPCLALFGPGVPRVFYPLHDKASVLHHVLSCNPCDQVHCVRPEQPCINLILEADVLLKMDEILHG